MLEVGPAHLALHTLQLDLSLRQPQQGQKHEECGGLHVVTRASGERTSVGAREQARTQDHSF